MNNDKDIVVSKGHRCPAQNNKVVKHVFRKVDAVELEGKICICPYCNETEELKFNRCKIEVKNYE